MLKTIIVITLLGFGLVQGDEPQRISWNDLKDVRFQKRLNKEMGMYFLYPTFGAKVQALNGKELIIKGYTIPLDPTTGMYVVSQNPMAMCFFCGGSGPETLIELRLVKPRRFKTDEIHSFKGRFRLNEDNVEELNYIFEEAEIVNK